MNPYTDDLPDAIKRQADRLFYDIERAGSMIFAVKTGAKAEGFILGITCCGGLPAERCELLSNHFDSAVEKRLRLLTAGL